VEKWANFKKKYKSRASKLNLCEKCTENNKLDDDTLDNSISTVDNDEDQQQHNESEKQNSKSVSTSSSTSLESSDSDVKNDQSINSKLADFSSDSNIKDSQISKVKLLELELARVKLELVDAQCKNQEFDHKLKGMINNSNVNSNASKENIAMSPNNSIRSNSTISQTSNIFESQMSASASSLSKHGSSGSNTSLYSNLNQVNTNNWLSKTFTHFKEATNQVVQKVKNNNDSN